MRILYKSIIIGTAIFSTSVCFSQKSYHLIYRNTIREVRNYISGAPDKYDIIGYPADSAIETIWSKIINIAKSRQNSELLRNIKIIESPIGDIFSTNPNEIFYDRDFFYQFKNTKNIDLNYLLLFSFSHELGHFVNGDVNNHRRSKESENNADIYACT